MTNRKKRLKRGIESLVKQIKLHEEKLEEAKRKGEIEKVNYYEKEIKAKKKDKGEKKRMLEKGG